MRYEPPIGVMFQDLDDESILLDVDRNLYFRLDAVSTAFWRRLAAGDGLDAAVAHLQRQYAVDAATLRADLADLLEELVAAGLLLPGGEAVVD